MGNTVVQKKGSPQGEGISPLLANIYLHVLDSYWENHKELSTIVRYADDAVVYCRTKEEAKMFEECEQELYPVKTRIVYCKDKNRTKGEELTEFDFLGYTFKAVYIKGKDDVMRNNFIASVSKTAAKSFRDKIKVLEIHKRTGCKIDMIAELLNPMIRGWMNYFGKFNPSAMKDTRHMGLMKCGNVVIPFDNTIEKGTDLYNLYNTNIHKKIAIEKKKEME